MPTVKYNGDIVSDQNIKTVLQRIATNLGGDVNVTSGDREAVVTGSSKRSHHLQKRAVDFWVSDLTLASAFSKIKEKKGDIFGRDKKYQAIHHGSHTNTGGAHLHVGRYASGTGVQFLVEGLTSQTSGQYSTG